MAKIDTIIFCSDSQSIMNGQLTINNPFTNFGFKFLPTQFSFSIVFRIMDYDAGKHTLRIKLKNKESDEVLVDTNSINIELQKNKLVPPNHNSTNISLNLKNIVLSCEGSYVAEVLFDDQLLIEGSFYAYKQ